MDSKLFDDLLLQIQDLYQQGQYAVALALVQEQQGKFPPHQPVLDYWEATLLAGNGDSEQAIAILMEAINSGFWFSDALMLENPALQDLQKKAEFQALVRHNQELRQLDPAASFPTLTLRPEGKCQPGQPGCPLLLTLHANASSARQSLRFWQPAAEAGWLVAAPQSTQAIWKDAYIWRDAGKAFDHILEQYALLQEQYGIDPRQVVIAGHSRGAEIAIQMALAGEMRVRGFMAVDPVNLSIEDLREWMWDQMAGMPLELRAVIYVSRESEPAKLKNYQRVGEFLEEMGVICRVESYQNHEGEIHSEDQAHLLELLAFLGR